MSINVFEFKQSVEISLSSDNHGIVTLLYKSSGEKEITIPLAIYKYQCLSDFK